MKRGSSEKKEGTCNRGSSTLARVLLPTAPSSPSSTWRMSPSLLSRGQDPTAGSLCHSRQKYLINTYHVPCPGFGAWETSANRTDKTYALVELVLL